MPEYVIIADPAQQVHTFSSRIYAAHALRSRNCVTVKFFKVGPGLSWDISPTIQRIRENVDATQGNNVQE
jgi:hypothetical protein